jgi:hypothetical protein
MRWRRLREKWGRNENDERQANLGICFDGGGVCAFRRHWDVDWEHIKMTKPTWIFNCGIYRSASTTQYQITRDIVENTNNGRGVGYHSRKKLQEYDIPNSERYIVCKAFVFLPSICRLTSGFLDENRIKAVCSIRDPRDVIASMKVRHNRHFPDPFPTRHRITVDLPKWLGDLQQWADLGPKLCYVSRYEDFTVNLKREVRNIAKFLDVELPNDKADEIAERYTAKAIQTRKEERRGKKGREDPYLPNVPDILFGKSGAHEEHLSNAERKWTEEYNRGFMERWGYL